MSRSVQPSCEVSPSFRHEDRSVELPDGVRLALRRYGHARPGGAGALVLHFHGGAFIAGGLDCGAAVAQTLAEAGAVVCSVDYPLADAGAFPLAVETGYAALEQLFRQRARLAGGTARVFVAGEEAGGNLAAAVALIARDRRHPPLAGQILFSPMLDPCLGTASLREHAAGEAGCAWARGWQRYLRAGGCEHPYAVPGQATRLAGLPRALLFTACDDPLRDETRAYAARLRQAGVAASLFELPAPSGWPVALGVSPGPIRPWRASVGAACRHFLAAAQPPATSS